MFVKRIILLIIVFILAVTKVFSLNLGSGTLGDPYLITNLADLLELSSNSELWNSCFEQTADIDAAATSGLNNGAGFSPIGINYNNSFTGSYDGKEFTISNLYIYRPNTDYIGLFGRVEGANISNVGVVDNDVTGKERVAGLVGHCHNLTTIRNCFASGIVTGNGIDYAGGLVGSSVASPIIDSYATGPVTGNDHVGGLVGYSSAPIENCYASGSVNGSIKTGGLVGISYYSIISNCYARGSVHGSSSVGGLAGNLYYSTANNCYATGLVQGNVSFIGGLVGEGFSGTVSNSFWNTQTSGQPGSAGGSGKTTLQMKDLTTYLNGEWDFTSTWLLNSHINSGYPFHIHNIYSKMSIPNQATNVSITPTISLVVIEAFGDKEVYFGNTPTTETTLIPFSSLTNPISYTFTNPLEYFTDYYWSVLLYDADFEITALNFTFKTRPPFEGLGTEYAPYQIANINDLKFLSEHAVLWDKHFIQTADIDASLSPGFSEESWFSPLGNLTNNFTGSYDGNGYLISNLHINRLSRDYLGLFGYINGAAISHVSLVDCEITGQDFVASLVAYADNSSSISNSYASGSVSSSGNYAGGLVAYCNSSTITNSYATSTVNSTATQVGGLVAYAQNSSVANSFWDIEATGQAISAGGIGKPSLAMTNRYTFIMGTWDFGGETGNGNEDLWNIHPSINSGYPYLITQEQIIPAYLPKFALFSYPDNEATNLARTDNLVWQADYLQIALGYKLNLGTDNPPSNLVRNQDLGLTTSYNYSNLEANTNYYWQVIPYNDNGHAESCSVWSFTTGSNNLISVGTGFNTYEKLPLNFEKQRSYCQSIILQSELNLSDRNIENLAFYLTDDFIISGANQWKIYLGHTDKTEFTANNDWLLISDGLIEVADVTFPALQSPAWLNIDLTTPFAYNNVDNLIVGVIEYSPGIVENPAYFYTVETNSNRSLTYGHNSVIPNPASSYVGVVSTSIPKINFTFGQISLTGLIKNSQNQPISNASLYIAEVGNFVSNALGEFNVENIAPGTYQMAIWAPWYETQNVEFEVIESQDNTLEITLLEELLPANNLAAIIAKDGNSVELSWTEPTLSRVLTARKEVFDKAFKSKENPLEVAGRDGRNLIPTVSYKLYRYLEADVDNQENWIELAINISALSYTDPSFPSLELGTYYWAVVAVYANNRMAEPIISNEVVKHSYIESSVAEELDFGLVYLTNESEYNYIILDNYGNGPLTISEIICNNSAFNLLYDDSAFIIEADSSFTIAIKFIPEIITVYEAELIINNNSSNQPNLRISLRGLCDNLPPASPEGVQITMSGNTAHISWEAVTKDINGNPLTPDGYVIYLNECNSQSESDFHSIGTTTDISFTHNEEEMLGTFRFYRVKAFRGERVKK